MNKFKKIMLGALSVLTLGLFVVTGAKVNATTVDTGYTAISIGSLKTTAKEISVYGTSASGKAQDVTNDYVAFNSNWNWYNEAINEEVYDNVTNNTGCTFDSLVIATGNSKTFSMKVPADKTKINCVIYLLCMVKADSTKKYSLKTSGTTSITIPNTVTNLKHDDTSVNSLASISADSAIHKVSFSYESTTQITVDSGMAILGFGVKDDSATYAISYNANGHGTAPTYSGANVAALNNSILGATISGVSGFRFTGWYLDSECTIEATTSSVLSTYADNGTVNLYAGWETITEYQIKFYVAGTLVDTKTVDVSGDKKLTSWPTDPTKTNAIFDGWYDGDDKVDANTVFTGDTTLVAKFNLDVIAIGTTKTLSYNDDLSTTTASDSKNYYTTQVYNKFEINISTEKSMQQDGAFKFGKAGSTSADYIAFNVPANSIAKISLDGFRSTTEDSNAILKISDGVSSKTITVSTKSQNVGFLTWENDSISDITLYVFRDSTSETGVKVNSISVSVVALEGATIADNSNLVFKAQYDGTSSKSYTDSTKLRFIGMIQGVSYDDYEKITSVQFSFTFNGSNRTATVNSLYKSVKNGSNAMLSAFDNTMYVVYTLRGINKEDYEGLSLTNCKLTVTFEGGSQLEVSHDNITLPSTFDSYYEV